MKPFLLRFFGDGFLDSKNSVRIQSIALRERMAPEVSAVASALVCERLLGVIGPQAVVGGYVPIRGEVDVWPAMRGLAERGYSLCLPVIEAAEKPLYFRRWRVEDVLEKGRYGIAIPPAGAPVFRPSVLLVPMVAFDRTGHRLGYGAGYYDRTISRLREIGDGITVIGVAFVQQEVAAIESAAHDERMDVMLTEKETIKVG